MSREEFVISFFSDETWGGVSNLIFICFVSFRLHSKHLILVSAFSAQIYIGIGLLFLIYRSSYLYDSRNIFPCGKKKKKKEGNLCFVSKFPGSIPCISWKVDSVLFDFLQTKHKIFQSIGKETLRKDLLVYLYLALNRISWRNNRRGHWGLRIWLNKLIFK